MASGDYSKVGTPWNNGAAPALSAANLTTMETQFEEAAYIPRARPVPPIVRWAIPGWDYITGNNTTVTANRTYYTPIYVPELTTYDRVGIYVQAGDGAGGLADLRIFEWTAGVPGALVLNCGTVSTNAAAAVEIDTGATVIGTTGLNGLYFVGCRCDKTPTIIGVSGTNFTPPLSGTATTNHITSVGNGIIPYDDAVYSDPAGAVDGMLDVTYTFVRFRES